MTSILATIRSTRGQEETSEQDPHAKCMALYAYPECSFSRIPEEMIVAMASHMDLSTFNVFKRLCKRTNAVFCMRDGRHLQDWKTNFEAAFAEQCLSRLKQNLVRLVPHVDILKLLEKSGGAIAGRFVLQAITEEKVQAKSVDIFVAYTIYDYKDEGLANGILNFCTFQNMKSYTLNLIHQTFVAPCVEASFTVTEYQRHAKDTDYGYLSSVSLSYLVRSQNIHASSILPVRFFFSNVSYRCDMDVMVHDFEASFDRCWATPSKISYKHLYEMIRRSGRMTYRGFGGCYGKTGQQMREETEQRKQKAVAEGFLLLGSEPPYY
jgi:hypothetical protein